MQQADNPVPPDQRAGALCVQPPSYFESQIPATVQVGTANSKGLSVMELDAKSPAAAAYMNLAKEVLAYA